MTCINVRVRTLGVSDCYCARLCGAEAARCSEITMLPDEAKVIQVAFSVSLAEASSVPHMCFEPVPDPTLKYDLRSRVVPQRVNKEQD